jgi:hypothetical protein
MMSTIPFAEACSITSDIEFRDSINDTEDTITLPFGISDLGEAVEQIEDATDCLWSYKTALVLTQTEETMPLESEGEVFDQESLNQSVRGIDPTSNANTSSGEAKYSILASKREQTNTQVELNLRWQSKRNKILQYPPRKQLGQGNRMKNTQILWK